MAQIVFTPGAWRSWKKLPPTIQTRLKKKLLQYAEEDPPRHATKLTDIRIGQYRFRIGDYRIVFDIDKNKIIIIAVGHRKNIYK